MIKGRGPLAALAALPLLTSAVPHGVPASRFIVQVSGLEITPADMPAPGTERVVDTGDNVTRSQVAIEHGAFVRGPASISISGLDYYLNPRKPLIAARKITGGGLPRSALNTVFCALAEQDRRVGLDQSKRYRRGFERYEAQTRLCLVDSDGDQRFDKAFVVGATLEEDWNGADITPIPYADHRHIDLGDDWDLRITYDSKSPKSGRLYVLLRLDGTVFTLSTVALGGPKPGKVAGVVGFDKAKLPYRFALGAAAFVVTATNGRAATIRYESNFDYAPLTYSLTNHARVTYHYY